jgi:hypothetical protein
MTNTLSVPLGDYPVTFRLPRSGTRDPYFGLTRSAFYELERQGKVKLTRLVRRGNERGITLVPFRAVARLLTVTHKEKRLDSYE